MLKKVLLGLGLVIGVFLIVVALQPSDFRIERSAGINAPADAVHPLINDFHNWATWSPWDKLDSNMTRSFSGAAAGTGAVYAWVGNKDVGEGKMTITDSQPNLIRIKLEFLKPMESTALTEFSLKTDAGTTTVQWSMSGTNNFLSRMMCLFMNMDKMVGGQFEQGLAAMKAAAEAAAAK